MTAVLAQRGPLAPWGLALRGLAAAGLGAVLGVCGPLGLGILAFMLLPSCTTGDAPPTLVGATLGCVLTAAVAPVAVAGLRLWWVGLPAGAYAVHGVLAMAVPLLTETQSGFCF